eukprot:Awhi_evm2s9186
MLDINLKTTSTFWSFYFLLAAFGSQFAFFMVLADLVNRHDLFTHVTLFFLPVVLPLIFGLVFHLFAVPSSFFEYFRSMLTFLLLIPATAGYVYCPVSLLIAIFHNLDDKEYFIGIPEAIYFCFVVSSILLFVAAALKPSSKEEKATYGSLLANSTGSTVNYGETANINSYGESTANYNETDNDKIY